MTPTLYKIRCKLCGELLFGADNVFCGADCSFNCKPERHRRPESMIVEIYIRSRAFSYRRSRRKTLANLFVVEAR